MQQDDSDESDRYRVFVLAAAFAALVVALCMYIATGGPGSYGIGEITAVVAFLITFVCALILSPFFFLIYDRVNAWQYFLAHLIVGLAIGALRVRANPFALDWLDFLISVPAITVTIASMSAWLFVRVVAEPKILSGFSSYLILLMSCLAFPALFLRASTPTDESCHNVFRNGRLSARPGLRLEFFLPPSQNQRLGKLYTTFAQEKGLSTSRETRFEVPPPDTFCNDEVLFDPSYSFDKQQPQLIEAFPHDSPCDWRPVAAELVCFLEVNLGVEILFTGGTGERIERPNFLLPVCNN